MNDCLPCRSGYTCSDEGIGSLTANRDIYACPLGYFCEKGIDIDPIPCIAGSFRDDLTTQDDGISLTFTDAFHKSSSRNPASIQDCMLCPEGFYCPIGTGNRYENRCEPGHICPAGSGAMTKCPPGQYCTIDPETGIITMKPCPEGFYCPMETSLPRPCSPDSICKEGSSSESDTAKTRYECVPGTYLHID